MLMGVISILTKVFVFFRCLAMWSGGHPHNFGKTVDHYFHEYMGPSANAKTFKGVTLADLPLIEKKFELNINVYELVEEEIEEDEEMVKLVKDTGEDEEKTEQRIVAKVVQRSHRQYADTMNVNLYQDHFSYIINLDQYCKSYACQRCGKLWKHVGMLHRHERTCEAAVRHKYVGGSYQLPQTIFEKLEDDGINIPKEDRFYPYHATYDFECYFDKDTLPTNSEKVIWEAKHIPLSVSLCSNIPGFTEPICFIADGDPQYLVDRMLQHLDLLAETAYLYLLARFEPVFDKLDKKIADALMNEVINVDGDPEDKKHPLEKLREDLEAYLKELPVVGFNSGKYDINVIKPYLMKSLQALPEEEQMSFVVKKNNNFMAIKTAKWKFVDILNYLAPGFSYSKFLKAFGCSVTKGFLPYEWITDLDEEYAYCQQVWTENKMQTFLDFLIWYNNR